jgi:hypothetical protein
MIVPRRNRVTPFGEIVAVPERGTVMGNRGIIHDADGNIRRQWLVKRWLVCVLEFRGRKRTVMTPNRYTELFFLDEATALAAGHRPCSECRHERFLAYAAAWKAAMPKSKGRSRPTADEMDDRLHNERVAADRSKRSYEATLSELPDGVFVQVPGWGNNAFLLWEGQLLAWSPGGYRAGPAGARRAKVNVLTPASTVSTIRSGYVPDVHPSAKSAGGGTL